MSRERHQRVKEIFHRICECDPEDRAKLIDQACDGDPVLRKEIEDLLAEDANSRFLSDSPMHGFATEPHDDPSGSELLRRLEVRLSGEDRYETRREIARGGMGVVREVWDADLCRSLAMKTMASTHDAPSLGVRNERSLRRFIEEARIGGRLDHPGIVPVHDLGLDREGRVYFTMRLVKGKELATIFEYVHEGREGWTQTRAVQVILDVCEALAYAHSKGVIHRDLKATNIMVGEFGEVYVMDWGIARAIASGNEKSESENGREEMAFNRDFGDAFDVGSPRLTRDGDVVGTPYYMSPEQARGDLTVGPAADVYALGAILYHLVAGHMPYAIPGSRENLYEIWNRVREGPPKPLAAIAPDSPAELVAICERAMAREPKDRYDDTRSMASELRAFIEGRVVKAHRTGAWIELRKWVSRNRGWAATGMLAVALLVTGLSAALIERQRANQAAGRAQRAQRDAEFNERLAITERERVLRLSDVKLVADYIEEADRLWPARPERIEAMELWLGKARRLYDRLPAHESDLDALEKRALPRSTEEAARERDSHPMLETLASRRGQLEHLESLLEIALGEDPPSIPTLDENGLPNTMQGFKALAWPRVDPSRGVFGEELLGLAYAERGVAFEPRSAGLLDVLAWARLATGRFEGALEASERALERVLGREEETVFRVFLERVEEAVDNHSNANYLAERIEDIEEDVARLEAEIGSRRDWRFPAPADAWQHEVLAHLAQKLLEFGDLDHGMIANVEERLSFAKTIRERSTNSAEARLAWDRCLESIADESQCPDYGGLSLDPQIGLMPLDRNPRTGLWEFWHLRSGTRPQPNPSWVPDGTGDGATRWLLTEESGMIFVLIPAGTFNMGAQTHGTSNVDPGTRENEGPVHSVTLQAFFLSKYEMTQGQWMRSPVEIEQPSFYGKDFNSNWRLVDRTHPVESVSWIMATDMLARLGLCLPTEAQWEYACRAGTSTVFWSGDTVESLRGAASIADAVAANATNWTASPQIDDGWVVHAPVGSFRANMFGLHDMHGNLWEWCQDAEFRYDVGTREGDGLRISASSRIQGLGSDVMRIRRGGSFRGPAANSRAAVRFRTAPETRHSFLGLRPARAIE